MGLLSTLSWPTGSPSSATSLHRHAAHSPADNRSPAPHSFRTVELADLLVSLHPSRNWPAAKVIRHIIEVHHRFLHESLSNLSALIQKSDAPTHARGKGWDVIVQRFGKLQNEFLSGMSYEESVVFPQLLCWEATGDHQRPPPELRMAADAVERLHVRCLHMLWRLLRLVRDEALVPGAEEAHRLLLVELSALCDDYEQQLFEEECLLLPRLTTCSQPPALAAQVCDRPQLDISLGVAAQSEKCGCHQEKC